MLKNGYLKEDDILGTVKYQIANGDIEEGTKIVIREIEFAGFKLSDVEASITHEISAPLLLGQSVISRLGKIQLDPSNSTLTILNGSGNFNYSDYDYAVTKNTTQLQNIPEYYYKKPKYTGNVKVFGFSPILLQPDMINSKLVGMAENSIVTIIRQENLMYYYVRNGSISGYLWTGWIKD